MFDPCDLCRQFRIHITITIVFDLSLQSPTLYQVHWRRSTIEVRPEFSGSIHIYYPET